jgi:hypothetical protein
MATGRAPIATCPSHQQKPSILITLGHQRPLISGDSVEVDRGVLRNVHRAFELPGLSGLDIAAVGEGAAGRSSAA